jgi:ribosomal protein S18 acetylase RimI-like enzyme
MDYISFKKLKECNAERVLSLFSFEHSIATGIEDSWTLHDLKRLFKSKNDYNYGLFLRNELIGFALSHINKASRKVYLENILISKEYRRQGLAKQLLNHLLEKYATMGNFRYVAQVNSKNIAALELLKSSDFVIGEKMNWMQKNDFN